MAVYISDFQKILIFYQVREFRLQLIKQNTPTAKAKQKALEYEKALILKALNTTNCKVAKTSEKIGVGRTNFYRLLEKHNLEIRTTRVAVSK